MFFGFDEDSFINFYYVAVIVAMLISYIIIMSTGSFSNLVIVEDKIIFICACINVALSGVLALIYSLLYKYNKLDIGKPTLRVIKHGLIVIASASSFPIAIVYCILVIIGVIDINLLYLILEAFILSAYIAVIGYWVTFKPMKKPASNTTSNNIEVIITIESPPSYVEVSEF